MGKSKLSRLLGEKDYSVKTRHLAYVCKFIDANEFTKSDHIGFETSMLLSDGGGPIVLHYDELKQSIYNLVDETVSVNPIDHQMVQTNEQLHFIKSVCAAFFVIKSRALVMGPRFEEHIYNKYLKLSFDELITQLKELHNVFD